jgi:hypothetical protein
MDQSEAVSEDDFSDFEVLEHFLEDFPNESSTMEKSKSPTNADKSIPAVTSADIASFISTIKAGHTTMASGSEELHVAKDIQHIGTEESKPLVVPSYGHGHISREARIRILEDRGIETSARNIVQFQQITGMYAFHEDAYKFKPHAITRKLITPVVTSVKIRDVEPGTTTTTTKIQQPTDSTPKPFYQYSLASALEDFFDILIKKRASYLGPTQARFGRGFFTREEKIRVLANLGYPTTEPYVYNFSTLTGIWPFSEAYHSSNGYAEPSDASMYFTTAYKDSVLKSRGLDITSYNRSNFSDITRTFPTQPSTPTTFKSCNTQNERDRSPSTNHRRRSPDTTSDAPTWTKTHTDVTKPYPQNDWRKTAQPWDECDRRSNSNYVTSSTRDPDSLQYPEGRFTTRRSASSVTSSALQRALQIRKAHGLCTSGCDLCDSFIRAYELLTDKYNPDARHAIGCVLAKHQWQLDQIPRDGNPSLRPPDYRSSPSQATRTDPSIPARLLPQRTFRFRRTHGLCTSGCDACNSFIRIYSQYTDDTPEGEFANGCILSTPKWQLHNDEGGFNPDPSVDPLYQQLGRQARATHQRLARLKILPDPYPWSSGSNAAQCANVDRESQNLDPENPKFGTGYRFLYSHVTGEDPTFETIVDSYVEGAIFSGKHTGIRVTETQRRTFQTKARLATYRRIKHLGEIGITFPPTEGLRAFEEAWSDKYPPR